MPLKLPGFDGRVHTENNATGKPLFTRTPDPDSKPKVLAPSLVACRTSIETIWVVL